MSNLMKTISAIMCVVIISTMFVSYAPLFAQPVAITPGHPVTLQFQDSVSSQDVNVGSLVDLFVRDGVYVDGEMVIAPGADAIGTVRHMKDNNVFGIPGSITIDAVSVRAVDGTMIPLQGSISAQGKSNTALAIAVGLVLCPLAIALHGENATIASGTIFTARVVGMQSIYVEP